MSDGVILQGKASGEQVKRAWPVLYPAFILLCCSLIFSGCAGLSPKTASPGASDIDSFINNPFPFTLLKNYSDDYTTIGNVIDSYSTCPLLKENIADPAFCFIRTIEYDGLTITMFSYDVLHSGTAQYIVTRNTVTLTNGLHVGSTLPDVLGKLGKPWKQLDDLYVWQSSDLHNYLAFTIAGNAVTRIRWHEERQPKYHDTIVWSTSYE